MKRLAQLVSWLALAATLVLPCLFFADAIGLSAVKSGMLVATVIWFVTVPFWMEHQVGS